MPWVHGDWIDDDESLARAPSRWAFDTYLREVLEHAGWKPLSQPAPSADGSAEAYARALLDEFGDLKLLVGSTAEIEFLSAPIPLGMPDVQRWPFLAGSMVMASVMNTYAALFVNGHGTFYVTDEICHGLYVLGNDFVVAMNVLVRSLPLPPYRA